MSDAPFADRRGRLRAVLDQGQLDALLVTDAVNVSYLTGFRGDSSFLLLTAAEEALISDARFTEQLAEDCPDVPADVRGPDRRIVAQVAAQVADRGLRRVGFESDHVRVGQLETFREATAGCEWIGTSDAVETLRQVKDAGEIALIEQAGRIAQQAFAELRESLRPGDTEKALHDRLEELVRRCGGERTAFPPIVGIGPRSSLAHALPTGRTVGSAPFVLIDWGACHAGYLSDMTRVVATGPIDAKLREIHGIVRQAQAAGIATLVPGATAAQADAAARQVIADAGYGERFSHGLGHGIGRDVHEKPFLRGDNDTALRAGMVITVEPGIYLPGWGGVRLEDDILVTADGPRNLTCGTTTRLEG